MTSPTAGAQTDAEEPVGDIVKLILADHTRIRWLLDALDDPAGQRAPGGGPALRSTPGTTASATQSRHWPSRSQATVRAVNGARTSVLRCRGLADHRVPVRTNHLPGGKPESAAKTRTARLRRST
jgi:hypothetical protein